MTDTGGRVTASAVRPSWPDRAGRRRGGKKTGRVATTDTTSLPPTASSLSLVVPVYNETHRFDLYAAELASFVAEQPAGSELLFIDDGSTDGTPDRIEAFIDEHPTVAIRLIRKPHDGKGAAVTAGLESATAELAGFCDLDLATPLSEFQRIVDAASRAPILAIGSRGTLTSRLTRRQSRARELLGRAYNRAVQVSLVPGVVDTQCGAKVAATSVWQKIMPSCREEGFAWDVEVIAVARALGVVVQEVGIEWRHQDGSRVSVARDGAKMLLAIPRIRKNLGSALRVRGRAEVEGGGAFDAANATILAEADAVHWWFRSKAAYVSFCIRRAASTDGWLADIGAGSGGVSGLLGWDPDQTLIVEGNTRLVTEAARRHALEAIAGDAAALPVADRTASVVCVLDVIQHLSDPVPALREVARILSPDGCLVVNVSAHPSLWSAADEFLGHARRYTRPALRRDLEAAGLEVEWMSHIFSWLTLPMLVTRRARPTSGPQLGLDIMSPALDQLSMILTRLEWAVASRVPLPVGTSIMCVARRAGTVAEP
jgi:dolichyl-phosphate beta-glucosyltransferase